MKRLTLTCLLLSFLAPFSVAKPGPQDSHETSAENNCSAGLKECKESLDDFKNAEQFMQLKVTFLVGLNQWEKSRPINPKITPVLNVDANHQESGNAVVYKPTVGLNRISTVPAKSSIQPVLLKSEAETSGKKPIR